MKRKLTTKELFAVGSMLFGLFFGAGNLIFPVHMGQLAGSSSLGAIIGFIGTGVTLPLLGVAAMGMSHSEGLADMSAKVGKGFSLFFTCALYLTIGPFFAIPRCATVTYTVGFEPMIPEAARTLALVVFSFVFFALVLMFSLRPSGILKWVGKIINPVFLAFLAVLVVFSFVKPMGNVGEITPDAGYAANPFFKGFLEGYNTMDALASLAFGIIVIDVIRSLGVTEPGAIASNTVKAGAFSCILMAIIYALITIMGAKSRGVLTASANGGIALTEISHYYFGTAGQLLLGATVFLACLKTSIGLVTSCAETFAKLFPRIRYTAWAVIFCAVPFIISNLGLTAIISYSIPVLMFLYPLSIALIVLCLLGRFFNYDKLMMVPVMTLTFFSALIDFFQALPADAQAFLHVQPLLDAAAKVLPFYSLGLGWICPALIGVVIGLILYTQKKRA
ncbi:MAG: branched-chain amino acid transport system II carrier protein [Clostridia bacterium]|nr:branched-chain amino acid transport system II carrier protein [Clostridia bacterium]